MPRYSGPVEYRVEAARTTEGKRSFRKKAAANKYAHGLANRLNQRVYISKLWDVGEVDSWEVEPYKRSSTIGAEFNPITPKMWMEAQESHIIRLGKQLKHATPEEARRIRDEMARLTAAVTKFKVEARERGRGNPAGLYDAIRPGSRVSIVNRFGQVHSGRAVMRGPAGWVLNMGGRYGRPDIASPENVVRVSGGKARPGNPESMLFKTEAVARKWAEALRQAGIKGLNLIKLRGR